MYSISRDECTHLQCWKEWVECIIDDNEVSATNALILLFYLPRYLGRCPFLFCLSRHHLLFVFADPSFFVCPNFGACNHLLSSMFLFASMLRHIISVQTEHRLIHLFFWWDGVTMGTHFGKKRMPPSMFLFASIRRILFSLLPFILGSRLFFFCWLRVGTHFGKKIECPPWPITLQQKVLLPPTRYAISACHSNGSRSVVLFLQHSTRLCSWVGGGKIRTYVDWMKGVESQP